MNFKWHPGALLDFEEAVQYYQQQEIGLDNRFVASVEAAIDSLTKSPNMWPMFDPPARRRLTDVFPYAVVYLETDHYLVIVAIMHESRQPGYWRDRLE